VLGAGPQRLVLIAALVGFGTKAGLMPLHSWLPRAHPEMQRVPGPCSSTGLVVARFSAPTLKRIEHCLERLSVLRGREPP